MERISCGAVDSGRKVEDSILFHEDDAMGANGFCCRKNFWRKAMNSRWFIVAEIEEDGIANNTSRSRPTAVVALAGAGEDAGERGREKDGGHVKEKQTVFGPITTLCERDFAKSLVILLILILLFRNSVDLDFIVPPAAHLSTGNDGGYQEDLKLNPEHTVVNSMQGSPPVFGDFELQDAFWDGS